MGYLFLAAALAMGVTKGYCGKKTSGLVKETADALRMNTLRMLFCILFGFFFVLLVTGTPRSLLLGGAPLAISALSGVTTSLFVVSWLLAVRRSAYMLTEVFLMLGVLFPMLLSLAIFGDPVSPWQWVGMGVLLVAVYLMCTYNNRIKKEQLDPLSFLLLLLCGLASGAGSFVQKWFGRLYVAEETRVVDAPIDISVFNFYAYVFAAATLGLCLVFLHLFSGKTAREQETAPKLFDRRAVLYILVMSLCLFFHSYFMTKASLSLSPAVLYPLSQGGSLILSSGMAALIFGERLNLRAILGILLAFGSLLLMNLL